MGRMIGLDLGTRTLGIAMSDALGIIATGIETFRFLDGHYDSALQRVAELVKLHQVQEIVLGLPLHMSGESGEGTQRSLAFAQQIEAQLGIKPVMLDERWTTQLAKQRLLDADLSRKKRKQVIDKMAAVVILQNYLDRKR